MFMALSTPLFHVLEHVTPRIAAIIVFLHFGVVGFIYVLPVLKNISVSIN
jgi:hypothetical protein